MTNQEALHLAGANFPRTCSFFICVKIGSLVKLNAWWCKEHEPEETQCVKCDSLTPVLALNESNMDR